MSHLNVRELNILSILWKADSPMTSTNIVNQQGGLTKNTVIAVLRKLVEKQLVEVAGITHSGKVISRTYRATEKSRKAIMDNFVCYYSHIENVIAKSDLCAVILEIEQNPEQLKTEISKLKEILVDFEKRL